MVLRASTARSAGEGATWVLPIPNPPPSWEQNEGVVLQQLEPAACTPSSPTTWAGQQLAWAVCACRSPGQTLTCQ